jgi:predicted aspartyl protease
MSRVCKIVLLLTAACGGSSPGSAPAAAPDVATVPLHVEGNRPFVDLAFRRADGTTRTARFLVDSGGGGFLIAEPLADELGLARGETMREDGTELARVTSEISVAVDAIALELDPRRVLVMVGRDDILPDAAPGHADGMLPGHVLAKYHVVFDYPAGAFTIARPGALTSTGTPLPMPVGEDSGFPRTEIVVDGAAIGMLLDTGASFTMMSQAQVEAWGAAHPDWARHPGAHGEAATLGGQALETMILPRVEWGGHALTDVGTVAQQTGVFEEWIGSMMAAPIVGALAGNVLTRFRVDLDYPEQQLYLSM